ncbi:MAG: DUF4345 domain-containing protein [Pseudomonadota bacterium]
MRRGLQVVLAILSLIPIGFGSLNFITGAARYMPADRVTAPIDSQFRYESAVYVAVGLMIWWVIPRVERMTTPFRLIALGIFAGGLGRLLSQAQYGDPRPEMLAGMWLELSLPVLIVWQWWVARAASAQGR